MDRSCSVWGEYLPRHLSHPGHLLFFQERATMVWVRWGQGNRQGQGASMDQKIPRAHGKCVGYANEALYLIFLRHTCQFRAGLHKSGIEGAQDGGPSQLNQERLMRLRSGALPPGDRVWTPDHIKLMHNIYQSFTMILCTSDGSIEHCCGKIQWEEWWDNIRFGASLLIFDGSIQTDSTLGKMLITENDVKALPTLVIQVKVLRYGWRLMISLITVWSWYW